MGPSSVTIADQLLKKRSNLEPAYWEDLVKSVAAVVYEGGRTNMMHCCFISHDWPSGLRYGIPISLRKPGVH